MEIFDDLVAAYRILAEHGIIDAYGHVSMRSPQNPQRYFIARALAPEVVQVEDIMEYDLDSVLVMWNVRKAREAAWTNGEVLWQLRTVTALQRDYLARLDRMTSFAGRGLLVPRLG